MAVANLLNASAANVDAAVSTLTIPFALAASATNVVHVAVKGDRAVQSVTDDQLNVYTRQAHVTASRETDYPVEHYDKNPQFDYKISGECWTATNGGTAATKVVVQLASPGRFAVELESYSGVTAVATPTTAALAMTTAPSITLTTTATNSVVSAGFSSAIGDLAVAGAGTLRGQIEDFSAIDGVEVAVADLLSASAAATTVSLNDAGQAQSCFAICAVELKA